MVSSALLLLLGERGLEACRCHFLLDFDRLRLVRGLRRTLRLSFSDTSRMECRLAKLEPVRRLLRLDRLAVSNSTDGARPLARFLLLSMAESMLWSG